MENENQVFRIMEKPNGFFVQREFIIQEEVATKWYQKRKHCLFKRFENVNEIGGRINIPFGFNPPLNSFKTLKEAKEAIDKFKKYPIYHYNEAPQMPKDKIERYR